VVESLIYEVQIIFAEENGVKRPTITDVILRRTWKHIKGLSKKSVKADFFEPLFEPFTHYPKSLTFKIIQMLTVVNPHFSDCTLS
jgi:hypothetical protein